MMENLVFLPIPLEAVRTTTPNVPTQQGEEISALSTAKPAIKRKPVVNDFDARRDALGNDVLSWSVSDPDQRAETFIVLAKYAGVTAPILSIPAITTTTKYRAVESTLSKQVGTKEYYLLVCCTAGDVFLADARATSFLKRSLDEDYLAI